MNNFLLRLFLSLCLVFLSGYSHLFAQTNQGSVSHSSAKILKSLEQASFANAQKSLSRFTKSTSSERENRPFKLKATKAQIEEEEEEERVLFSSKKYSGSSNYFTATFWAQALSYFLRFGKAPLPVYTHFAYIPSSRRHLLIQVFRI